MHDKSQFNIYLYSFTPKDDEYTQKAKESGCIFRDIKDLNDIEVVNLARNDELDIAIDLMGYTTQNRAIIFSHKVAPIQVTYLSYEGLMNSKGHRENILDPTHLKLNMGIAWDENKRY